MNEHELKLAGYLRDLEMSMLKSAANVAEKQELVDSFNILKQQLTLIVGRRIIKETYKNG